MDSNAPFPDRPIFPDDPSGPDEMELLTTGLRVLLTVLLGRSQMLQRRIRTEQVTNVYACMETLARIDEAVLALEARLARVDEERALSLREG